MVEEDAVEEERKACIKLCFPAKDEAWSREGATVGRLICARIKNRIPTIVTLAPDSNAWGDGPFASSKPNFVMVDDPVLYLIVRMEDQNRILSIMSRAGYYIKDVTTDRKVDGAYVTYTFTQRKKT